MKLSTKSISKCFNGFLVLRSLDVNNQNSSTPSSDVSLNLVWWKIWNFSLLSLIIQTKVKITYLRSTFLSYIIIQTWYISFIIDVIGIILMWLWKNVKTQNTRYRVNLHFIVDWMSRNSLYETDTISEV